MKDNGPVYASDEGLSSFCHVLSAKIPKTCEFYVRYYILNTGNKIYR